MGGVGAAGAVGGSASFSFSVILELIWTIPEISGSANLMRKHIPTPPPNLYDNFIVDRVHPKVSFVSFYIEFSQQLHHSLASLQAFIHWTSIGALYGPCTLLLSFSLSEL